MLDPKFIRSQPEKVRRAIALKGERADLELFLGLDERRRGIQTEAEELRARRNAVSEQIGKLARAGADPGEVERMKAEMRDVGASITGLEQRLAALEAEQEAIARWIPNVPHETVPEGDASNNQILRHWGTPAPAGPPILPHWDIGAKLGLLDFERAGKVAGSGFILYTGLGARLERALIQFFLDSNRKRGYTEVSPPYLVREECLFGTGQLPKLEGEMYRLQGDDLYLNPTAEVPVTNIHRDEILSGDQLPLKLTAYCPSFRREAGAAGRETRGMVRVHQFDKVEAVKFVLPETSYEELELLVADAESLLQALELPYRVVLLAAGDLSFAASKCYDLEAWAPAEGRWLEVSSCSCFEAFQARRANIRFRREVKSKPEHVHTLNGSVLALPRVIVALLEQHQTPDGRVRVPRKLQPYLDGREYLED
ncbi:MAG TPA: serine--tRNA ligase [Candidatus Saccharimonadales bacterium]|nr:serine--tRNA ligase [Candidatus Saccharimonadales bacterium]